MWTIYFHRLQEVAFTILGNTVRLSAYKEMSFLYEIYSSEIGKKPGETTSLPLSKGNNFTSKGD